MYSRRVEEPKWKAFVCHQTEGRKDPDDITFADMKELVGSNVSTTLQLNDDGSLHYAYRTGAARATLFGSRLRLGQQHLRPLVQLRDPAHHLRRRHRHPRGTPRRIPPASPPN